MYNNNENKILKFFKILLKLFINKNLMKKQYV